MVNEGPEWGSLGLRSVTAQPLSLLLFHITTTHSPLPTTREEMSFLLTKGRSSE